MKTSLAIVLTAAALISATVSPATACYSKGLCGAVALPNLDQAPRPLGPGPYRGQM
jgi:hypothetical protein